MRKEKCISWSDILVLESDFQVHEQKVYSAETRCPSSGTRCPSFGTRCPSAETKCPSSGTIWKLVCKFCKFPDFWKQNMAYLLVQKLNIFGM